MIQINKLENKTIKLFSFHKVGKEGFLKHDEKIIEIVFTDGTIFTSMAKLEENMYDEIDVYVEYLIGTK